MRKLFVFLSLLFTCICFGQSDWRAYKPIVNMGYQFNSHSQVYAGLEYSFISGTRLRERWNFVGAGVMATPYRDKWYWLPYADFTRSNGLAFISTRLSTHHIQPQIGVTMLNLLDIGVGYSFAFKQSVSNPVIKGFTLSFKLRITKDKSNYLEVMRY
ncbi:hypothetical protein NWE55_12520 [Myroides albus]|uniref:hypothetical protein n=1 Tax=Myroides albus TaxID=2562892 RepID=UPI0021593CE2|nr:hypothetical protein [Myroides albus]UVD78940.1 hypothetical protein NWE55_12520 [Myroides albus]